ncbi:MAG: hypothetical protein IH985_05210 [Planctomycetes bacterium]|nr:hypothetical protein [Planctomycetota bacterium]
MLLRAVGRLAVLREPTRRSRGDLLVLRVLEPLAFDRLAVVLLRDVARFVLGLRAVEVRLRVVVRLAALRLVVELLRVGERLVDVCLAVVLLRAVVVRLRVVARLTALRLAGLRFAVELLRVGERLAEVFLRVEVFLRLDRLVLLLDLVVRFLAGLRVEPARLLGVRLELDEDLRVGLLLDDLRLCVRVLEVDLRLLLVDFVGIL